MEQVPIVRRRVRIWPVLLTVLVVALLVAAVFYVIGDRAATDIGALMPAWHDLGRGALAAASRT